MNGLSLTFSKILVVIYSYMLRMQKLKKYKKQTQMGADCNK